MSDSSLSSSSASSTFDLSLDIQEDYCMVETASKIPKCDDYDSDSGLRQFKPLPLTVINALIRVGCGWVGGWGVVG